MGLVARRVDRPRRERWTRATAAVAVAYGLNTAIKLAVGRRRPDIPELPPLTGTPTALSFPSAHATTSFAAARAYAPLLREAVAPGAEAPLWVLAGALALSRLYLGVHYPSDVLAGAALGVLIGGRAQ
jgi:undecaprenyl-diphosphatase